MSRVDRMGTVRDMKERQALARTYDNQWRGKVDAARETIYQKNYAVDSDAVEKVLKDQSLVPTTVSVDIHTQSFRTDLF